MHRLLEYPFDGSLLLKKRKSIKKTLLQTDVPFLEKRIAVLGGSTTHDIKDMLELFLLNNGIQAKFYESEFGQYWQDAMFENQELMAFQPDIIFIHTSNRNLMDWPSVRHSPAEIDGMLTAEYNKFSGMWGRLAQHYACPVIQNNFEYPFYRLLGNKDASDVHGRTNYITRLNLKLYEYAQTHGNFYMNDINYLSADYGLEQWADPFYWHMYKYALCLPAIPRLAFSVANIIKSLFGKNKKAFALDLDNTLWGGIVGDDGVDGLEIGPETSIGQVYSEFQSYLKAHKELGVLLNVVSKNDRENAIAGLNHPDSVLKPEDCIEIEANWEPKSVNLASIAEKLALLPESFVFVDDNPAEREIIRQQLPGTAVPELERVEHYINQIDRSGFFEVTALSEEDLSRSVMYRENVARSQTRLTFTDYADYLHSLDMKATIGGFTPLYLSRIAQLTNKSNQFNLTTRRYTQEEIAAIASDDRYVTLCGRLEDKFGDNGIVTVVIGEIREKALHMGLWLMSCRVLKRDMEYAMMDELVRVCRQKGLHEMKGYFYPTAKNGMVCDFYAKQGFVKESEDEQGNTAWQFMIDQTYQPKNSVIAVEHIAEEGT